MLLRITFQETLSSWVCGGGVGTDGQSVKISLIDMGDDHVDMGDDHVDTVISLIISPCSRSIHRMTISIW
jgi:hypothetical protein